MQDIRQETLNECTRAEQSASVVLWEIDLTEVGGEPEDQLAKSIANIL